MKQTFYLKTEEITDFRRLDKHDLNPQLFGKQVFRRAHDFEDGRRGWCFTFLGEIVSFNLIGMLFISKKDQLITEIVSQCWIETEK